MSQKKRTFINSDEELIVNGSLIVQGEFIQKATTIVQTETLFQGDTLVINSDGTSGPGGTPSSATLEFRTQVDGNVLSQTITLDPSNPDVLVFSAPVQIPGLVISEISLSDLTKLNITTPNSPKFEEKSDGKIEFTGRSASAVKLEEPITIGVSGDMTGTVNIQNSGSTKNLAVTLNTVNTDTGTWGQANLIPVFTVNGKGLITDAQNVLVDITASQVNDFTDAIDAYLSGDNGVVYNAQTGVIEANVDVLRTFHVNDPVGEGENGLTYVTGNLSVDATVVRTFSDQTIDGEKTYQADATFESNVEVQGELTVQGNVLLPNDIAFIPETDGTVDLGTPTRYFGNLYVENAQIRTLEFSSSGIQDVRNQFSGSDGINYDNTTGEFEVDNTVVRTLGDQTIDGEKTFQADATFESNVQVQAQAEFQDNVTFQSDVALDGNLLISNDTVIAPATDSTVDLGTSANHLGNVFTDTATIRNINVGQGAQQTIRELLSGSAGINYDNTTGEFEVDNTVVRTLGDQTIDGEKTFQADIMLESNVEVQGELTVQSDVLLPNDIAFIPATGNTVDLGTTASFLGNLYVDSAVIRDLELGSGGIQEVRDQLSGSDGINYDNTTGEFEVDDTVLRVDWINDPADNGLTYSTGNISVDETVIRTGSSEVPLNQTIYGSLNVVGNLNSITQIDLYLEDNKIILNKGMAASDAHIKVSSDQVQIIDANGDVIDGTWEQLPGLRWKENIQEWQFSNDGETYYPLQTYPILQGGNAIELTANGVINAQAGSGITVTSSAIELAPSGVTAGDYGQADQLVAFSVDQFGRITTSSNVTIDITASQVNDFTDAIDSYLSGNNGIVYNNQAGVIEVDTDVVRTFGVQSISGEKTIQDDITIESAVLLPNDTAFIPATDSTVDLGTSAKHLGNVFTDTATVRNISLGGNAAQTIRELLSGSDGINFDNTTGEFEVDSTVLREQRVADGLAIDTETGNLSVDDTVLRVDWLDDGLTYATGNISVDSSVIRSQWVNDGLAIDTETGNLSVDDSVLRTQWVNDNADNGLTYTLGNIAVDDTVVRTSGDQSIAGSKQFTGRVVLPDSDDGVQVDGQIFYLNTELLTGFFGYIDGQAIPLTPVEDTGFATTAQDAVGTGIEILAGTQQVQLPSGTSIFENSIRTIDAGTNLLIGETSNVITISANVQAIRGDFSASTVGSFGSLTYNNSTGVFTYTTPTTTQIRQQISATGLVSYNSTTGVISTDADQYTSWSVQTETGAGGKQAIGSGQTLEILGGTNITVTNTGNVITIQNDNLADITGVVAGDGLVGGGDQGNVTLTVGAGDGIQVNPGNVAVDSTVVRTSGNQTIDGTKTFSDDVLVDKIIFDGGNNGAVEWNTDEDTLNLQQNGSVHEIGQETLYNVRNNTGSLIAKGTPVMATGAIGNSGRITVAPMDGTNPANAKFFIGVTKTDIADDADGKVTHFGKIRGIDTSAYTEGTVLYISTTNVGQFTSTEPTSGMKLAVAFVVTSHASAGAIIVRATNGLSLGELNDVNLTGLTANSLLSYNSSAAEWVAVDPLNKLVNGSFEIALQNDGALDLANKTATLADGSQEYTTDTTQVLDSFNKTKYRTAKYLIQALSQGEVHATEVLITHNDTVVFVTEYATIKTGGSLIDLSVSIDSENVNISITPVNANTSVDFYKTLLAASSSTAPDPAPAPEPGPTPDPDPVAPEPDPTEPPPEPEPIDPSPPDEEIQGG